MEKLMNGFGQILWIDGQRWSVYLWAPYIPAEKAFPPGCGKILDLLCVCSYYLIYDEF